MLGSGWSNATALTGQKRLRSVDGVRRHGGGAWLTRSHKGGWGEGARRGSLVGGFTQGWTGLGGTEGMVGWRGHTRVDGFKGVLWMMSPGTCRERQRQKGWGIGEGGKGGGGCLAVSQGEVLRPPGRRKLSQKCTQEWQSRTMRGRGELNACAAVCGDAARQRQTAPRCGGGGS
eukprot:365037-Chlamydomonas_euryale.AAC.6